MKRDRTLSVRVTEQLMLSLDDRAKQLSCSKGDLVERALNCFLGLKPDEECTTHSSVWNAIEDLQNRMLRLEKEV
jgi:hypothetical protein